MVKPKVKPQKNPVGVRALREIKTQQKSTKFAIARIHIARLVLFTKLGNLTKSYILRNRKFYGIVYFTEMYNLYTNTFINCLLQDN